MSKTTETFIERCLAALDILKGHDADPVAYAADQLLYGNRDDSDTKMLMDVTAPRLRAVGV